MESYFEKEVKIDHTKICTADFDSPCRELSVRSLGFVVTLLVFSGFNRHLATVAYMQEGKRGLVYWQESQWGSGICPCLSRSGLKFDTSDAFDSPFAIKEASVLRALDSKYVLSLILVSIVFRFDPRRVRGSFFFVFLQAI